VLPELVNLLSKNDKDILFIGIGNVLKQDDGAGVYITRRLIPDLKVKVLTAEVSIENYIGKINSIDPDILIIVDCVDLGSPPGTCRLLDVSEIRDLTFNTHNISLRRISEFFRAEVFILGIQPANLGFGENLSYLVEEVSNKIINLVNNQEVRYGS
jgi:hydrogenase 3 maturation protease